MSRDNSAPSFSLSEGTPIKIPLSLLLSLLGICIAIAGAWFNLKSEVATLPVIKAKLEAHDTNLAKLDVMANDLAWIKAELRRQHEEARHNPP